MPALFLFFVFYPFVGLRGQGFREFTKPLSNKPDGLDDGVSFSALDAAYYTFGRLRCPVESQV